jgi:GT2 family glycosyltransferase/glycosyltransferase involved in cell wall biosynthesis
VPGHRLWLVHLPAELYEGRPCLIGLHVRSGDRVLESASFSFIGSDRVLHQPGLPPVDRNEARAEQNNPDSAMPAAGDGAAPPAALPAAQDRLRLGQFLEEEFGSDTAKRVLGYFDIIEELGAAADQSRLELLTSHVDRMQLLSQAANDGRPVEATVVIPAFEHVEYTIASVISLLEHPSASRYEIIIGNNVSSDETAAVFEAVGGVLRCITHQANEGFIRNCNLSARHASGRYVVLLNNDTLILDHWLDELLAPFGRFNGVGLVGSKLLMADGSLQEAGGIIWRDASGWNFGRGQDPTLPQFNYIKDVDYVSGAAIAIPAALWDEIGGFDERYVPAYFDDSDLAFTLRDKGWRTLYAPASQVIHHEGISHGTDETTGTKAYQAINRDKFTAKWQAILTSDHYANGEQVFLARDRSGNRRHILVVDHYIPQFDRDAGSRTIFSYVKMFVDGGLQVSFWPDNLYRDREYLKALQDLGVEVLYGPHFVGRFPEWIKQNGAYLDYAFLSRAHVSRNYIDGLKEFSQAKILYYGHDLPYERLEGEYKLTGKAAVKQEIEYWREAEMEIWRKSDVIYYPAPDEVEAVRQAMPDKIVRALSIYVYPDNEIEEARLGRERSGPPTVMFVAGFRHRPNVDAAVWFVREVLPLVRLKRPEIHTILAGSFPPPAVTGLADERVLVTGYISDTVLEWFYQSASLAILPLRFGGGIKGKLIEALRFGVPVVTTSAGAQGLPEPENYVSIGDTPQRFAERIIEVVENPGLVQPRVLRGLDYIQREFAYSSVAARMALDIPELGALASGPGRLARAKPRREIPPRTGRTARGRRAAARGSQT